MAKAAPIAATVAKSSNRGSKPGERRGGRVKGTPNKATACVREVAQQYTEQAVETLVEIMQDMTAPPAARVSASNSILDRAHGKPTQSVDHQSSDRSMSPRGLDHFYGLDQSKSHE